ncbi:MAG: oxidoreductase [Bryobacteraceae bacterium]
MNPPADSRTALLAGATGLTGGCLLRELAGRYSTTYVLARRTIGLPPRCALIEVDFDRLPAVLPGADVYCALGTTIRKAGSREAFRRVDYGYPLAIARAARAGGARQFLLVSSVGADPGSANFYLRVKGELEEALAGVGFDALHLFRPGVLLGDRGESRPGEAIGKVISIAVGALLAGPLRKYRAMPADRLARAMVQAGVRSEAREGAAGVGGRHVYHWGEIAGELT